MAEHNELGKWGEDEATLYLENEGYVVIDRDWKAGKRDHGYPCRFAGW